MVDAMLVNLFPKNDAGFIQAGAALVGQCCWSIGAEGPLRKAVERFDGCVARLIPTGEQSGLQTHTAATGTIKRAFV
jgi:hypothetical protein